MAREIALDVLINERYHLMVLISESSLIADLRSEIQSVAWEVFPKLRDKQVAVIKAGTGAILPDRYKVGQLLQNGSKVFSFSSDFKRSKNRKRKLLDSERASRKIKRKRLSKDKWPILRSNGTDRLLNCENGYPSPGQSKDRETPKDNREPVDQNEHSGELSDEIQTVGGNILQDEDRKGARIKPKPSSVISHHCDNGGSGHSNANVKDGRFDDDDDDDDGHKNDAKAERGGRRSEEKKSKGGEKQTWKDRKEDTSSYRKFDEGNSEGLAPPSEKPVIEKNFMEEVTRRHYPATSSTEVMLSASSNKDLFDLGTRHHTRKRKVNEESVSKVTEWLSASVKPLQSNVNQDGNDNNCSSPETVSVGSCDNEAHSASQRKSWRILTGKADKSDNKGKCTKTGIVRDKEQKVKTTTKSGERKEALLGENQDDNRLCSEPVSQGKKDGIEPLLAGVVSDVIDSGPQIQPLRCQIRLRKLPVGANGTKLTGRELIDRTSRDQSGDLNTQESCGMGMSPTEVTGPMTRSQHEKNRRSLIAPSDMKDDVEGVSTRGEGGQAFEDAFVCGEAQSRRAQRGAVVVRDMGVQTSVTSVIDSPGSEVESGFADNEGHNIKSSAHQDGVNGDDDMNDVDDDLNDDHNVDDVVTQEIVFSVVESREPLTGRVRRQQKEERPEEPSDVLVSTATESSSKGKNLASQIGPKNFAAGKGDSKCRKRLLGENDDHTTTVEKRDESEDSSQKAIESPVDRRTTRSQHAAKKTILLASQCGLREDREVLAPVEGNVQSRTKMTSENEELDSNGRRKTIKQMETEETRGKDVQDCSDAAKNDSDSKMANSSSNGEDVGSDMERFISKYALQFCTGKRLRSRREVKKGEASQKLGSSSKKGLKSGKETLAVGENVHEARSESKETGTIGSRRGRNLGISDDEAQEKRSDLSETKSQQNGKYSQVSDEERQSKSRELFQTETVQNPAHAQICPAGGDEHVTANEAFDSDETLKDIDTINCAPQEKVLSPSVDQVSSENDSESETLRGSDVEEAMECSVSGEGHCSPVPVNQPENDEPRTVRSSSKETSEKKQLRSASDRRNTNSPKSRVDLETSVDRTHHPRESSTAVVGSPATLKHPTEDSLQSIGKDMAAEKGKSKKLDVFHNGLKSDFSGKGCEKGSAHKGSRMEELTHKQDDEDGSSDSGSGTEGGKDSSVLMVDRLKLFKRGKQVTWWEERDEIEKDEDGGKSRNREENTNDQTKAKRTKVDEESYKEQPQKCTRKKVVCKIGREAKREMDGKREVLSQENERKENLGEGDNVSKDEKKNKGRNTVCDEAERKVGQEIGMDSESKTTKDNKKEKLNGKTESDFAFKETSRNVVCEKAKEKLEEECERKATNRKNIDKTTHKRVVNELEQKERNEDISDDAKDLKRKLDDKSSCEDVIKSKQKRPRDIAKSAEEKDEGSKQNSLKSKTKGRKKKKETEISAEELVASPKLQKVQGENAEKTKDDSAFSKSSTQSAIDGAGVVVSCKVDKNGRNVKLQSSVSMKSENSKTRKKETLEAPKENVKKSKPTQAGSTPVDNETEYSSQDSVTSMKIEKIKKRGKQKQENSLERNGLGFHNTQELSRQTDEEDLNHESTVSKGKRKTRKNEVMDILRDIDNELASYNTEVVRCSTDENERISCQESVVTKKGEKEKKRRKGRATALDEKEDDTDVDKTQVLSSESAVGREEEDNQKPVGEIRTEKAKKREPQRKKCSRKNGNELVIDDKPESEKWEGRSQELTGSINVKTAKEKTKDGRKTEEKNTEKHLSRSRSRPEKSEILEETDGQEQSTNQKSSAAGIKSTKTGKKRREKVEPDSKEKSKALSGNDSLCQNDAKEEPSMEGSGDKAASKKKTKSGLSLMDLVQDAERESPEKKTSSNSEKRSTPKELVSQRFLETPHGFQHTTKRRKTSSSTSTVHVKRKSRSGKPEAPLQLEPLTPIERHLIAGVSLDKLLDDDSFWDS